MKIEMLIFGSHVQGGSVTQVMAVKQENGTAGLEVSAGGRYPHYFNRVPIPS